MKTKNKQEEVRINMDNDYEINPISPMRKIERKLESLENSQLSKRIETFTDKMFSVTELNQKIIDDVIRSNHGLREDLSVLIGKIETLTKKMESFMNLMNQAMEIDVGTNATKDVINTISKPIMQNINEIVQQNKKTNDALMQSLDEMLKTMKRMQFSRPIPGNTPPSNILARRRIPEQF
ncbi:MAG: hypothetical protein B6U87_00590 [Candidatus Aenigmarchaeota archaeon ex4484_52]|nr:MAG: hypothetical protein B6U87_00590 [Candidatus Aenigmarchaeota archaeon ex4484_52]